MQKPISGLLSSFGLALAGFAASVSEAHAQSLPQLDFATYPPQLIWLGASFVALYLLMSRLALPKVGTVLEERRNRIEDNLNQAETLRTEAQAAEQAYETALSQARSEAASAVKDVRDAAAAKASQRQTELGATLTTRIQKAEASITAAKETALADIRTTAAEAARAAAEKLAGETPDEASVLAAVDKAMEGSK